MLQSFAMESYVLEVTVSLSLASRRNTRGITPRILSARETVPYYFTHHSWCNTGSYIGMQNLHVVTMLKLSCTYLVKWRMAAKWLQIAGQMLEPLVLEVNINFVTCT